MDFALKRNRPRWKKKLFRQQRRQLILSGHTEMVWTEIERAVGAGQRDLRRGVLPRDVQARLPYSRAEGSLRRDMIQMYRMGRLIRLGGDGARQGYRLPTRMERMAFTINQQWWPVGCERLQVA